LLKTNVLPRKCCAAVTAREVTLAAVDGRSLPAKLRDAVGGFSRPVFNRIAVVS
jgi:hypothetical protein